jgi:hypothetical protein
MGRSKNNIARILSPTGDSAPRQQLFPRLACGKSPHWYMSSTIASVVIQVWLKFFALSVVDDGISKLCHYFNYFIWVMLGPDASQVKVVGFVCVPLSKNLVLQQCISALVARDRQTQFQIFGSRHVKRLLTRFKYGPCQCWIRYRDWDLLVSQHNHTSINK